jgi:pimeloyl-ACP methyl ester carboxylesterase
MKRFPPVRDRTLRVIRPVCILLPGIIAPAVVRYAPLRAQLGAADTRTKELEVYALSPPPESYSIEWEVEGLAACVERAGIDRFHLYGHSAGGAVALAFAAAHPEKLVSLALDEPAFDFSDEMLAELGDHLELQALLREDPQHAMPRFMRMELAEGVDFQPPAGAAPPLPNRPAGIAALLGAFARAEVDVERLKAFERPVLYTRGSLSAPRYARSAQRLAAVFPDYREVVFEGVHHLNTSHQAEPARVAELLTELWGRS